MSRGSRRRSVCLDSNICEKCEGEVERERGMDETDRQPPPSDVTGSGRAAAAAAVVRR